MQALGRRGRLGGQSLTNSQLCYGFVAHAVELVSAADADPASPGRRLTPGLGRRLAPGLERRLTPGLRTTMRADPRQRWG